VEGAAAGMAAALFPSASVRAGGRDVTLSSAGVSAAWTLEGGRLRYATLRDRVHHAEIPLPREVFTLVLGDGTVVKASEFTVEGIPRIERDGVSVRLVNAWRGVRVAWRAIARGDAQYLRQELEIAAIENDVDLREVHLYDFPYLPDAYVAGRVDGSPIVSGNIYASVEHPLAQSDAIYDRARTWLPREIPLRALAPLQVSGVLGVVRTGQLRRDFLAYLERERARPYKPFLHYNSWYDIGYFTRYDQAECLQRIHAFGQALHVQRGVRLQSFLFDDGWDDPKHLWQFNAGFPDGFVPLREAARQYGAAPGAWLSPWGGYGEPRDERLASARTGGYEINDDGLALSGPKYYALFKDVVERFIRDGGVNQFKIDGTGSASKVFPGSSFGSDFEAAIALIADMRRLEPDIYVNLTTGTYPSPFWLRYCDSIWRGGDDHNFAGEGTHRQKWITYRDADTYAGIVVQGPLYPLNSLMLHGLIYAQHAKHLGDDPGNDFPREVHAYFAGGTQLQEMYCTPALLSRQNWDEIARWARWSAANAGVLRDTHWIGGDPDRGDVYGWAAWSPRKSIVTLRNPRSRSQQYLLDYAEALEVPAGVHAPKPQVLTLEPFEVRTIER
jgi:hypothetical protein